MELKKGFKQTEVGIIPEDWNVRPSAEVCLKIQDGTHFSPSIGGNDNLYVTSKNIGFGILDVSDADRIDASQHKAIYSRCDVRKGDLLLTKDGANTGNAALDNLDEEISLLSSVAFLRFDPKHHIASYYLQQILSPNGQKRIKELMAGNAITRLTLEKIRKFRFAVPPLPEQRVIAAALSDVDALLASLDKLIAKKRDIKQGTMQELLTGKKRLAGFGGEWEEKKLGEIASIIMGQSPDSKYYNYKSLGVPLIQGNADIENRQTIQRVWTTQITKSCSKDDLLLTVRAPVGSVGMATQDSCIGRGVCAVRPINVDKKFLFHALVFSEGAWKALEQGSTFTSANSKQIGEFGIAVINSTEEQQAIATILSDMDAEIAALEQKREKTRLLKQGMMQELLTGKTRLL